MSCVKTMSGLTVHEDFPTACLAKPLAAVCRVEYGAMEAKQFHLTKVHRLAHSRSPSLYIAYRPIAGNFI
jgi:hypothetical protein